LKRSTASAAILLASALTFPAFAQMPAGHPYVGANIGGSHLNGSCGSGLSCDQNDTAWKVYGGWTFPGDFGAELTYYDLGKFTTTVPGTAASGSLRGTYWGLGGAWLPQLGGGWGAAVRVGAAYGEGKLDVSGLGSESRNAWHPYGGIGASYAVAKNIKIEADWDWTRISSQFTDPTTGIRATSDHSVQAYSIGASFLF
jgi:OOP family OmpA-OmpF porin